MNFKDYIASIPDFPQPGVLFRDITPLMADGEAFHEACEVLIDYAKKVGAQVVAGPESRGFIFGCPVAHELKIGFVPVRKPNKLPRKTISYKYDLEYGSNELHIHADAIDARALCDCGNLLSICNVYILQCPLPCFAIKPSRPCFRCPFRKA